MSEIDPDLARVLSLQFEGPLSQRPGWPEYKLPERKDGEGLRTWGDRIVLYQREYFETVRKLGLIEETPGDR